MLQISHLVGGLGLDGLGQSVPSSGLSDISTDKGNTFLSMMREMAGNDLEGSPLRSFDLAENSSVLEGLSLQNLPQEALDNIELLSDFTKHLPSSLLTQMLTSPSFMAQILNSLSQNQGKEGFDFEEGIPDDVWRQIEAFFRPLTLDESEIPEEEFLDDAGALFGSETEGELSPSVVEERPAVLMDGKVYKVSEVRQAVSQSEGMSHLGKEIVSSKEIASSTLESSQMTGQTFEASQIMGQTVEDPQTMGQTLESVQSMVLSQNLQTLSPQIQNALLTSTQMQENPQGSAQAQTSGDSSLSSQVMQTVLHTPASQQGKPLVATMLHQTGSEKVEQIPQASATLTVNAATQSGETAPQQNDSWTAFQSFQNLHQAKSQLQQQGDMTQTSFEEIQTQTGKLEVPQPIQTMVESQPSNLPTVSQQIEDGLTKSLEAGKEEFTLRLTPENLGEITVKLVKMDGIATLVIQAAKAETANLINRELGSLQEAMRSMDIQVKPAMVNEESLQQQQQEQEDEQAEQERSQREAERERERKQEHFDIEELLAGLTPEEEEEILSQVISTRSIQM